MLSQEQVDANAAAIRGQLEKFLDFSGNHAARLLNNAEWLRGLNLLEFLRDTGKHFTVNYMLQKDSVKSRMDSGISFTEFTYMLVQAYDFWHLHETMGVELQMGGSDQWGNITAGIELIGRRAQKAAHGLVFPLLTTAAGNKFGKSEDGNVWLDPRKTSAYKFYQFWLNTDDRDVAGWLKLFTFMELDEIEALLAEQARDPGKRAAQRRLALEVTSSGARRRYRGTGDCGERDPVRRAAAGGGVARSAGGAGGRGAGCVAVDRRAFGWGCRWSMRW